jgi:protein TonB
MPSAAQGVSGASRAGVMTHMDGHSDRDGEQRTGQSVGDAGFSDITRTSAPTAHDAAALAPDAETAEYARPRCESCGMFATAGSTLCEPCQRSFAGVLQPAAMTSGFGSLEDDPVSEAVTIVAPPPPAGVATGIAATLEQPYAFTQADAPVESEAQTVIAPQIRIEQQTVDAEVLPSIQPAIAAATPDLDEPRPWWERQHDATPDVPTAEPPFVPRGPATPPPVNAGAPPYVPQYVAPPAIAPAPQVGVAYGNGAPSADHASRRSVQPRVPKPLPMAPPPVRKGRGALISGAVVLAVAAVGAPLAWNWSGLGAFRVENTATTNETHGPSQQAAAANRASERTRPRPSTQYGSSARATKPATPVAAKAPTTPAQKPKRQAPVKAPVAAPVPHAPTLSASALSTSFVPTVSSAPAPPPPPPPQEDPTPTGPVFEVAQVDMRPDIASRVDPVMPSHLSARRVEDVVVLRVLVSAGGSPSEIRVLRRARVDAALDAAAIAAVRQWRFVPARKKGQAVHCWYNIGVSFSSTGE